MRPPAFPPSQPRRRPAEVDAELAELTRARPPADPAPPEEAASTPDPVSTRLRERLEELRGARLRARYRTLGIVAGGLLAIVGLVWFVAYSPVFALESDEVEITGGNEFIPAEVVREMIAPHVGTPLLRVDVGELREELTDHYAVKEAEFTRVWPSGLKIALEARTPVAASPKGKGFAILDGEGIELGTSKEAVEGLPVVNVDHGSTDLPETLAAVLEVMDALPPALLEQVRTVGAVNPDEVEFTLTEGEQVIWGSALDLELKVSVLEILLEVPAQVYNVTSPLSPITS